MEALRELYIAIKLVDDVTKPLKQLNKSVDKFKNTVKSATKPVEELRDKYLNMSAAFDQSLSSSKYFFTQMDLATKEAIIRAKQLPKPIQDIAIAFERVKTKVSEFADVVRSKFSGITKFIENYRLAIAGLGAALTGVGLGGLKIFGESAKDFERAILEMKARTHMTTKEFEEMVNTLKQLAKVNSDSFQTISQVLTIVNERFGELGTKTRIVAQAILDFAKITGSDAVSAANALSVAMKAYNIPATKIYEVTDILISAQQRFGVSAVRLAELLYNNGAAMRKLGLTFNETVAILAAMESKGVNISRALLGLRSAIDKIGGTDNFRKVLRELASIQDKSERTRRALEIFGSYAGPGIAAILDNGINGLNKYLLKLDEVRGTTLKASATIDRSLSEQLGILRNNLNLLKVELGTALLPILKSGVKIVKQFVDTIQSLPAPVKGVLATLTALITIMSAVVGPILVQIAAISWLGSSLSQIIKVLSAVRFAMIGFASSVWTTLAPLLPLIAIIGAAVGAILILQDVLVKGWEKSYLGKFVNWLLKKLPFLKPVAEVVGSAINRLRQGFEWLAKSIKGAIYWSQQAIDKMGPLKYLLLGPVGGVVYLITHFDKLRQSITSVPDAISRFLGKLGPLKYILLGPVGSIILLTRNLSRLKSATSSALMAIKSLWDRTIGLIIKKIDEFITKIKQAWNFMAKSPIGKLGSFMFNPVGAIMQAVKIIQPKIKPVIEKPEMDKRFYEEGSVVLKVKTPKIKPEIERPELTWLEELYKGVQDILRSVKLSKLSELIAKVRFLVDRVSLPEISPLFVPVKFLLDELPKIPNLAVKYVPDVIKSEIPADLTKIVPTPSQLVSSTSHPAAINTYNIRHEHKTINVPKIEIRVEGVRDTEKVAELVIRKIRREFDSIGIY